MSDRRSYSNTPQIPHIETCLSSFWDTAARSQIKVQAAIALSHAGQTEQLNGPTPRGMTELVPQICVVRETQEQRRQIPEIARTTEPSDAVVFSKLEIAARTRRHHWQPARHRLDDGVRHTFADRGQNKNVHRIQQMGHAVRRA